MPPAQPLNVTSAPAKVQDEKEKSPQQSGKSVAAGAAAVDNIAPQDISSPHELTAFVETLLTQLDSKFDTMSEQILDRMNQMSTRVDALEAAIQDIINGDVAGPQSPSPTTPLGLRRNDTGS